MRMCIVPMQGLEPRNDSETMLKNRSSRGLNAPRCCLRRRLFGLLLLFLTIALSPTARAQFFGPFNDNFANSRFLSGASGTTSGFTFGATSETNEPIHGAPGGASVWFAWIAPDSGTATFDTFGSSFDTLLAAYSGTDLTNLVQKAANDDAGGGFQSRINFSAERGQTYFIAVDGFQADQGQFTLTWN